MNCENSVVVSGAIHLPKGDMVGRNRHGTYLKFALKQMTTGYDGVERPSFLPVRVFDQALQEQFRAKGHGDSVRIAGTLRSSTGSGEMFILAESIENTEE